jgi:hypothetical protein
MRAVPLVMIALLLASPAFGEGTRRVGPEESPFKLEAKKPQIVFHVLPRSTAKERLTVTGVVFSRAPIDRVELEERDATIRPAEAADLVRFERVPPGASEAPYRTYFEVTDAALDERGANALKVRAYTTDGRSSHLHRVTVLRTLEEPAS